ncbi:MAG: IPT/TIG domain-containing protein [Candidatus Obscuribacterales bacterium]|nr:IPT/TIG domain-containing protein [Candidatus Obscuribacterales bacterium]
MAKIGTRSPSLALLLGSLLLVTLLSLPPAGQCQMYSALSQVQEAQGGPYIGRGGRQRFVAPIKSQDGKRRTWLTIYNGYGEKPGFASARVILTQDTITTMGAAEPAGYVITDDSTFRVRSFCTKEVTGELSDNSNLVIDVDGPRGAQLAWTLSALAGPSLSPLNPSSALSGRSLILHGDNFSLNPAGNTVTFNGKSGKVIASSRTTLTVIPPESLDQGSASIVVTVNGVASNGFSMGIRGPVPILTSLYPDGGPPGEILTIYGRNFARPLQNNLVQIGPFQANVLGINNNGGLRVEIPDWGTASTGLSVSVISNGIPSRNNLTFYPYPHIFVQGSPF